jgi:hypothetical protein
MTDDYAKADEVRIEAYGVLRLMHACNLEHVRGQPKPVWMLRYAVAAHMMELASPPKQHTHEDSA